MSTIHLTKLLDTYHNELAEKVLKLNKAFRKAWEEALLLTAFIDEESAKLIASDVMRPVCEERSELTVNINLQRGRAKAKIKHCADGLQPIVEAKTNSNVKNVHTQLKKIAAERVSDSSNLNRELLAECTPCTVLIWRPTK